MSNSKLVQHRNDTIKCVFRKMTLLGQNTLEREKTDGREASSWAFIMAQAGDAVARTAVLAVSVNWKL